MSSLRYKTNSNIGMALALLTFSIFLLLLSTRKAESKPIDIGSLLPQIIPKIVDGVYAEEDIDLFGYPCQYKRIPYIKKWELHYKAEVRCLGWTPVVGKARDHRNPTNAEQEAIKDFVRQILVQGLITEEDAKLWLNK